MIICVYILFFFAFIRLFTNWKNCPVCPAEGALCSAGGRENSKCCKINNMFVLFLIKTGNQKNKN